ncbi:MULTISPECIES: hypothetical protein [unclassified Colwellia]|uniref:hypothetical protein n=1 Tax=unclassified Colwellia TaxID=196834 RepID=UPI0015F6BD41|nr:MULTISPECIES: hypothetical protein [unclassified Colwellia]MBA6233658.1 hypothetical protein [Colwellia sp. MB02u-7]MBA6237281.1 hypothetical protein [Colwellia sp. MB02u-11]MBA6257278.1 hypothetical protein [Colwellia sp. MB3u-28]MBA6258863.1 hypothetical protein [Colwellia sp. MB3u-41]MBA6300525.1 hypothetical protein [Colwellia sp. MB3u-22]
MKSLALTLILFIGCIMNIAHAEIVAVGDVKITEISAYDDYQGGIIRIEMTNVNSSCPNGGYLNPNSVGFDRLYSLAIVAATTQKIARFQLYNDKIIAGLCEIDAIRLNFS